MKGNFYLVSPEVAGQLGNNTILDYSTKPPRIIKLHYQFDGWLGDDILEGFQCFICSKPLSETLMLKELTGFSFEECETSKSDLFIDIHPELELPQFYWLKVFGKAGDDFFLSPNNSLILSEKALNELKKFHINHCDIETWR